MPKARSESSAAGALVSRLNTMVAQVLSTNRKLQRQVEKLSQPVKKKVVAPRRTQKTQKTARTRGRRR